jgi:hypothetical protein
MVLKSEERERERERERELYRNQREFNDNKI